MSLGGGRRGGYGRFALSRLVRGAGVAFGVSLLTFALLRFLPGDPAGVLLGEFATPESIAATHKELGLDGPLWSQLVDYYWGVFSGDLGTSYFTRQPVLAEIKRSLPVTLNLLAFKFVVMAVVVLPLVPLVTLSKQREAINATLRLTASALLALPVFVVALFLQYVFSLRYALLPAGGYDSSFPEILGYLLMPALVSAIPLALVLGRVLLASVDETLREDFVESAIALGLSRRSIMWHHVLRPSLAPAINLLAFITAAAIASSVLLEVVFNLPGLGNYLVVAILARDYAVVQSTVLIVGVFVVAVHVAADLVSGFVDPRTRESEP